MSANIPGNNMFGCFSSFFLMGPVKQIKKMIDPNRIIATLVMLVTIVLTFLAAFLVLYIYEYVQWGYTVT
jgi:hypothetical protein